MKLLFSTLFCIVIVTGLRAQNQNVPGAGNALAAETSGKSKIIQSAYRFLQEQARSIHDPGLRKQTLEAISNPQDCVRHRAHLSDADKDRILHTLIEAGLLDEHDDAAFPGGLKAGIFPAVIHDGSECPLLPQSFFSAPGSYSGGHHSYPGGLAMHEAFNAATAHDLAANYELRYGTVSIDHDILIAAPIWHDWAKTFVFQWNKDGTEFQELEFGGDKSKTGGHHILGLAETMKRGFSPAAVITQACAHSSPSQGNEFKVVKWLRAAAIIAQIDPVEKGYLMRDSQGNFRLPALRKLGGLNSQDTNLLPEYTIHNLSDGDFVFTIPAAKTADEILRQLAPEFGFNSTDTANYNNRFRNPVLSNLTSEKLVMIYSAEGIQAARKAIQFAHK